MLIHSYKKFGPFLPAFISILFCNWKHIERVTSYLLNVNTCRATVEITRLVSILCIFLQLSWPHQSLSRSNIRTDILVIYNYKYLIHIFHEELCVLRNYSLCPLISPKNILIVFLRYIFYYFWIEISHNFRIFGITIEIMLVPLHPTIELSPQPLSQSPSDPFFEWNWYV